MCSAARPRAAFTTALLLLALTAAGLYTLRLFDAHPRLLTPRWASPNGVLPSGSTATDAVVILDPDAIRQAAASGTWSTRDSSAAWLNWVGQELGPSTALRLDQLTAAQLRTARLVVLTRSLAGPPTPDQLKAVSEIAARGGAVVLELPDDGWKSLTGVVLSGDERIGGRLTDAAFPIPPTFAPLLRELELPARYRATTVERPDVTPLLWLNSTPVAFGRPVGPGFVVTLAVDLGHLWQTLQQGRPDEDLQVRNRYLETLLLPLETNDLVTDPALLTAGVPVADLLEDGLFRLIADAIALPAWWPYPSAAPGAFLMSHDEEGFGDRAAWMAEDEGPRGCPSTNFLVPSPALSREGIARFARAGGELGLHYVLPDPAGNDYPGSGFDLEGRYQTYGLWKLQPVRRLYQPLEQLRFLTSRAAPVPVAPATRTHFLAWTEGYADLFQSLEAAGIRIDSSYGPDLNCRGFLFGTARPFHPLDAHGLPLSIYELPFVSAEDLGGADHTFLTGLLEQSATLTHQALSVLFHPNSFSWHPSVPNYQTWKALCGEAGAMGHWVTTFARLEQFTRARERSPLQSEWRDDRLIVHHSFSEPGATLALPVRKNGLALTGLEPPTPTARTVQVVGGTVALIPVPSGPGTLTAHYGPPIKR